MAAWITVATTDELGNGDRIVVEIDEEYVAIFCVDGRYYAINDVCTHDDGPLADGELVDQYKIECPRHGAMFDIRTGEVLTPPAVKDTRRYDTRVEGDEVQVLFEA